MRSHPFETRSLPSSLATTHRGFAFYVAFPKAPFVPRFSHLCRAPPGGSIRSLLPSQLMPVRLGPFYVAHPARSILNSYFLNFPSTSYFPCADHHFYAAAFCSSRIRWGNFAFSCFALPRRYCSTAGTALGRQPECVGDQLLGRFLSLVHVAALLLGRVSVSICADRYGLRSHSRSARLSDDSLGKPRRRIVLHSESLARVSHCIGNRCTFCVWLVARHALRQWRSRRSALVDHGLWNTAFPGSRRRIDSLLSGLLHWSSPAPYAP